MTNNAVYGLLLAGGKSRRLGHDKALLDRDGQSQLAYLAGVLGNSVERVFVSTRPDQVHDKERSLYEQIVDRYHDLGPVAGILSALEEYPHVDWLVVACDLPNVDDQTIRFLLRNRSFDHPFTAFVSTHDSLPEPLCAVYRAQSVGIVRAFVADGLNCPRKIMIRSDTWLLPQPNPRSLDNVNTPEDLSDSRLRVNQ